MINPARAQIRAAVGTLDPSRRAQLAQQFGVSVDLINRAASVRDLNAMAFLALCLWAGIGPLSGKRVSDGGEALPIAIDWTMLAIALRMRRIAAKRNVRKVAAVTGLSIATLSRAENGRELSAASLLKLCAYLGVSPLCYVRAAEVSCEPTVTAIRQSLLCRVEQ